MNFWLLSIICMISTCTATRILYVLPDNVSDVNCPSQPCATLGRYLLDNGSLPVLSNVEYHFLPGQHHVFDVIDIEEAFNFSLIGFGLLHTNFVCCSQTYVRIFRSYNVIIKNLVFDQCSGDLFPLYAIHIAPSLFLYDCSHCIVENIVFFGYGFAGINLFLNSYISNITINLTTIRPDIRMCSPKFFFGSLNAASNHDKILINQLFITGHNELCYELYELMIIQLNKSYGVNVELYNMHFYAIDQIALHIEIEHTSTSVKVKNCTFKYIMHYHEGTSNSVVHGNIPLNNVAIWF